MCVGAPLPTSASPGSAVEAGYVLAAPSAMGCVPSFASAVRSACMTAYDRSTVPDPSLNLRACRFYYVIFFNLAEVPKRTVQYQQYLRCPTFPRCQMLDLGSPRPGEAILSTWQEMRSANKSYGTVRLAKSKILVQMSISLFSKSYGKSLQKIF
jgi:hypothetical protein